MVLQVLELLVVVLEQLLVVMRRENHLKNRS
jgi:hypothetical protein